ncbi:hypothetical protein BW716_19260 [[Flexibacter] sp. ATCC 35208]|nr:hypothetical protein BW716_19260 [[Flexibacter] sp. ATCC 35208]
MQLVNELASDSINHILVNHTSASGNLMILQLAGSNVARVNKAGRGFFNGGTQTSGADAAGAFAIEGKISSYSATEDDRTVALSSEPYSTLVVGVYATKPGVLLTEDEELKGELTDKVPMG